MLYVNSKCPDQPISLPCRLAPVSCGLIFILIILFDTSTKIQPIQYHDFKGWSLKRLLISLSDKKLEEKSFVSFDSIVQIMQLCAVIVYFNRLYNASLLYHADDTATDCCEWVLHHFSQI